MRRPLTLSLDARKETHHMATEEDSTPENRARRVEKQWRHEERALSSTHAFWGTLVALHGAIAGLAGVLVALPSTEFPPLAFAVMGLLSIGFVSALARINALSIKADEARAAHFAVTSRQKWPDDFDSNRSDGESKALEQEYKRERSIIEPVALWFLLVNALIFAIFAALPSLCRACI